MELLIAALPGVITSCLLLWVLVRRDDAAAEEREELRVEIRVLQTELTSLARTHAEQLERLSQDQRREVATLCQRLQAPEIAVAEHVGQNTLRDPTSADLENDEILAQIAERENDLRLQELSLRERAEELAAER